MGELLNKVLVQYIVEFAGRNRRWPQCIELLWVDILAYPQAEVIEMEISGRNLAEGVPKMIKISSNEVLEALHEPLSGIVSAVKLGLEQTPPELCADVAERGIVLTGGGALLRDLDRLISDETGLHVQVADDPLTCVARGGGRALELVDMHGNEFFAPE